MKNGFSLTCYLLLMLGWLSSSFDTINVKSSRSTHQNREQKIHPASQCSLEKQWKRLILTPMVSYFNLNLICKTDIYVMNNIVYLILYVTLYVWNLSWHANVIICQNQQWHIWYKYKWPVKCPGAYHYSLDW